jgi:serine/threonine protein phosphatase PrpC
MSSDGGWTHFESDDLMRLRDRFSRAKAPADDSGAVTHAESTDSAITPPATDSPVDSPAVLEHPVFPKPLVYENPRLGSDPADLPNPSVAVPDTVLDGAKLGGVTVRGASLRGDDHRYLAETRQDSMGIWAFRGSQAKTTDAILVCVADGVGSEPYSQVGSARACELLREEMETCYQELLSPELDDRVPRLCHVLAGRLDRQLTNVALQTGREPKSLSTTLVGALIEADSGDPANRRCVVFAIGDSPAFVLRNGVFQPCFQDSHEGVISSTGTAALPSGFRTVETSVFCIGMDDVLLICSDGLSNPMRNAPVEQTLATYWGCGEIPSLLEFGWQLSFRARSYGDDRTAVCVWGR